MRTRTAPPLWFLLLLAAAGVLTRYVAGDFASPAPAVHGAFLGFLIMLGELIWKGVEVAGRVTLAALAWTVRALSSLLGVVRNGLAEAGRALLTGFKKAWDFVEKLYDDVLKPAWEKFWKLVDHVRQALERVLKPVFKVLFRIRAEVLKFYDRFVRPVLDIIGVMRKTLHVFSALGMEWAKKLDAQLAKIEDKIDAPFRLLLRQLNEIINVVNRVVTADGLFQRLALVKSIVRDFSIIGDEFARWHRTPLSATELAKRRALKYEDSDPAAPGVELGKLYQGKDGAYTAIAGELVSTWRLAAGLGAPRVP